MANHLGIKVVNKLQKKAVVIDVAIPSDSNIKTKEQKRLEKKKTRGEGGTLKDVGIEGNSDASGNASAPARDPQTGTEISDPCPEGRSSGTAQILCRAYIYRYIFLYILCIYKNKTCHRNKIQSQLLEILIFNHDRLVAQSYF